MFCKENVGKKFSQKFGCRRLSRWRTEAPQASHLKAFAIARIDCRLGKRKKNSMGNREGYDVFLSYAHSDGAETLGS